MMRARTFLSFAAILIVQLPGCAAQDDCNAEFRTEYCSKVQATVDNLCDILGYYCDNESKDISYKTDNGVVVCTQTTAVPCPSGYYCPSTSTRVECPVGSYCHTGSSSHTYCMMRALSCPEKGMSEINGYNLLAVLCSLFVVLLAGVRIVSWYRLAQIDKLNADIIEAAKHSESLVTQHALESLNFRLSSKRSIPADSETSATWQSNRLSRPLGDMDSDRLAQAFEKEFQTGTFNMSE